MIGLLHDAFGNDDLSSPYFVFNLECRNPIAFKKIQSLINNWSDNAHNKEYADGNNIYPGDFPAAHIEDAGEDTLQIWFRNPGFAAAMMKDIVN